MIFNVVYALGELAIMFPISGGFYTYSVRFIDPAWGFAMGWNYVFQWAIVLPLELVVAGLTVNYWGVDLNVGIWITVFFVIVVIINIFGVLGYAEEEFWAALLKLSTVSIFLVMGVIFVCGGGPSNGKFSEYHGAKYWYNPGAFAAGFPGLCSVFVTAAFSFSGTELVGLAAAESETPQKSLPSAIKQVFWRITLFYILGLFFVGLLVPYDDPRLLGSGGFLDVSTSPFVITAVDAGIPGFGDFVNAVILVSVISIGLSGVYGGSRTLTALAERGYAPQCFMYIDRAGRPLWSTVFVLAWAPLAYITLASTGVVVFNWLVSLSGLAALFTWGSICLAHIRFRAAWKYQGHTTDELPFKAVFGVVGSWIGLILIILVLIAQVGFFDFAPVSAYMLTITQFYVAIRPMDAEAFFSAYLAIFVVIAFYIVGWLWKRQGWHRLADIDVDTGRREIDWEHFNKTRAVYDSYPKWRKFLSHLF
jgi:amino acid transporter